MNYSLKPNELNEYKIVLLPGMTVVNKLYEIIKDKAGIDRPKRTFPEIVLAKFCQIAGMEAKIFQALSYVVNHFGELPIEMEKFVVSKSTKTISGRIKNENILKELVDSIQLRGGLSMTLNEYAAPKYMETPEISIPTSVTDQEFAKANYYLPDIDIHVRFLCCTLFVLSKKQGELGFKKYAAFDFVTKKSVLFLNRQYPYQYLKSTSTIDLHEIDEFKSGKKITETIFLSFDRVIATYMCDYRLVIRPRPEILKKVFELRKNVFKHLNINLTAKRNQEFVSDIVLADFHHSPIFAEDKFRHYLEEILADVRPFIMSFATYELSASDRTLNMPLVQQSALKTLMKKIELNKGLSLPEMNEAKINFYKRFSFEIISIPSPDLFLLLKSFVDKSEPLNLRFNASEIVFLRRTEYESEFKVICKCPFKDRQLFNKIDELINEGNKDSEHTNLS